MGMSLIKPVLVSLLMKKLVHNVSKGDPPEVYSRYRVP